MVDEDLKNNPTTTVTTYTVGMTDASDKAARWALNKATGKDAWTLTGLFYPGCKDSDGIGGTISHVLTEDNSSFPPPRRDLLHAGDPHRSGGSEKAGQLRRLYGHRQRRREDLVRPVGVGQSGDIQQTDTGQLHDDHQRHRQ